MSIREPLQRSPLRPAPKRRPSGPFAVESVARRRVKTAACEVLILGAAIFFYFFVRGLINGRVAVAYENADRIIGFERTIGVFVEPDLQAAITGHDWLVDTVNAIYMYGHWPVIVVTLIWLLTWHRDASTDWSAGRSRCSAS